MSVLEPFTPAECDLRGMPYMPLYGDRLFGSATWIGATSEGKVAALRLWWRSFAHEVPAASRPDDDTLLADYSGYGVGVKAWLKVKPQAMRGWVKCSDGRLYHKTVAEVALEAWEQRKRNREKQERWRNKNRSVTPSVTVTGGVTEPLCNAGSEGKGEGREGTKESAAPTREDLALAEWQSGASGHGWRSADFMTSTRRFKLMAALEAYGGLEGWKRVLDKASEAGFFLDDNNEWHGWFSLDWLLDGDHIARLLEGAYADRKKPPTPKPRYGKPLVDPQALPSAEPWEQRMQGWHQKRQWIPQAWGPRPGEPGCRAPKHLIGTGGTA
jgi:hypothetical protein